MGNIFQMTCNNCGYEKQLKVGAGMMSIREEVVNRNLQGDDLGQWQELQESRKISMFSWKYEMAYCNTCKDLQSCFVVDIRTNDGETKCLGGRCGTCLEKADVILQDEDITCPLCGQKTVSKNLIGRWD